jgi:hypothetical protein
MTNYLLVRLGATQHGPPLIAQDALPHHCNQAQALVAEPGRTGDVFRPATPFERL